MDRDAAQAIADKLLDHEALFATRERPKTAPAAMLGERVLVRQRPPEAMSRILHIPDTVDQPRPHEGLIVAAGAEAAGKLFDAGVDCGDWIWYAKYAGVVQVWEHDVVEGDDSDCKHAPWTHLRAPDQAKAMLCEQCGCVRVVEPMVAMPAKDPIASVDLQIRLEKGHTAMVQGTDDGRPAFWYERAYEPEGPASWAIDNRLKNPTLISEEEAK